MLQPAVTDLTVTRCCKIPTSHMHLQFLAQEQAHRGNSDAGAARGRAHDRVLPGMLQPAVLESDQPMCTPDATKATTSHVPSCLLIGRRTVPTVTPV